MDFKEGIKLPKEQIIYFVIGAFLAIVGIAVFLYVSFFYYRVDKRHLGISMEIPPDLTPAEAGLFYFHYKGGCHKAQRLRCLMTATILDLIRKGYLIAYPEPSANWTGYCIAVAESAEERLGDLKEHEIVIFNKVKAMCLRYHKPAPMMTYYLNDTRLFSEDVKSAQDFYEAVCKEADSTGTYFKRLNWDFFTLRLATPTIAVVCALLAVLIEPTRYLFLGLAVLFLTLTFSIPSKNKFNYDGECKYLMILELVNYYKNIDIVRYFEQANFLVLEQHIIYATAFQLGYETIEKIKRNLPELSTENSRVRKEAFMPSETLYLYFYVFEDGSTINLLGDVEIGVPCVDVFQKNKTGFSRHQPKLDYRRSDNV